MFLFILYIFLECRWDTKGPFLYESVLVFNFLCIQCMYRDGVRCFTDCVRTGVSQLVLCLFLCAFESSCLSFSRTRDSNNEENYKDEGNKLKQQQ